MSGIEIVGLAASVLQLADTGLKLSVKLYTFTRKIKSADRDIDALSHEISITGAVLQQLGETLSDKKGDHLCKPEAVATARRLIEDCKAVFTKLEKRIKSPDDRATSNSSEGATGNHARRNVLPLRQRLTFTFLESEIGLLRVNLERLKISLLIILNVLVLAEQVRNREAHAILMDQKSLLEILVNEKVANEKRYNELNRLIKDKNNSTSANATTIPRPETTAQSILPDGMRHHHERIINHGWLVTNLLQEVDSPKYDVDHAHRLGLRKGILDIHWNTWSGLRQTYGHQVFTKLFSAFHDVTGHWNERAYSVNQSKNDANIQGRLHHRLPVFQHTHMARNVADQAKIAESVEADPQATSWGEIEPSEWPTPALSEQSKKGKKGNSTFIIHSRSPVHGLPPLRPPETPKCKVPHNIAPERSRCQSLSLLPIPKGSSLRAGKDSPVPMSHYPLLKMRKLSPPSRIITDMSKVRQRILEGQVTDEVDFDQDKTSKGGDIHPTRQEPQVSSHHGESPDQQQQETSGVVESTVNVGSRLGTGVRRLPRPIKPWNGSYTPPSKSPTREQQPAELSTNRPRSPTAAEKGRGRRGKASFFQVEAPEPPKKDTTDDDALGTNLWHDDINVPDDSRTSDSPPPLDPRAGVEAGNRRGRRKHGYCTLAADATLPAQRATTGEGEEDDDDDDEFGGDVRQLLLRFSTLSEDEVKVLSFSEEVNSLT